MLLKLQPNKSSTNKHNEGAHGLSLPSDRSEGPHNIFRPDSALSQSDDDLEDIEESLPQSINKLQSLQSQLSGINKNTNADQSYLSNDSLTPRNISTSNSPSNISAGSTRKNKTSSSNLSEFSARNKTFRNGESDHRNLRSISPRDLSNNIATSMNADGRTSNGLANNMTTQGQKQKTKASLSSIENSYQNIKHKTPVNQVGQSGSYSVNQVNHVLAIIYALMPYSCFLQLSSVVRMGL